MNPPVINRLGQRGVAYLDVNRTIRALGIVAPMLAWGSSRLWCENRPRAVARETYLRADPALTGPDSRKPPKL